MADFWTDQTSVFFTSFWGWTPETWSTIGWTGPRGATRRANLVERLSDPFIAVCYVTGHLSDGDPELKGKIAGFYLVSHELGDRDEFTHPIHHGLHPEKWRHSLRALRAFSYLPEQRLTVSDLDPGLLKRARAVAGMGEVLTDPAKIALLRDTPWIEVDVYQSAAQTADIEEDEIFPKRGSTRAGPASGSGYVVPTGTQQLDRQLYILRLSGNTDAYLGKSAKGRSIYKIGLSASPEMRKQSFQKSMPRGAFRWEVYRTTANGKRICSCFKAAVAGEDSMKKHLVTCADWLGGEFYLATEDDIENAWQLGRTAARSFRKA